MGAVAPTMSSAAPPPYFRALGRGPASPGGSSASRSSAAAGRRGRRYAGPLPPPQRNGGRAVDRRRRPIQTFPARRGCPFPPSIGFRSPSPGASVGQRQIRFGQVTLAKVLMRLVTPDAGRAVFTPAGPPHDIHAALSGRSRPLSPPPRRLCRFQDPMPRSARHERARRADQALRHPRRRRPPQPRRAGA